MKRFALLIILLAANLVSSTQVTFSDFRIIEKPELIEATGAESCDVDNDGWIDVVVGMDYATELVWYRNLEGNGFSNAQLISETAGNARAFALEDIDLDGDCDIIVADTIQDAFFLHRNAGDGLFDEPELVTDLAENPKRLVLFDMNGDEYPELVASSWLDEKLAWYENLQGEGFGDQQIIEYTYGIMALESHDMDGDGLIDLVVSNPYDHVIEWYKSDGTGQFTDTLTISDNWVPGVSLDFADIDEDGDVDVLETDSGWGAVNNQLQQWRWNLYSNDDHLFLQWCVG